MTNIVYGPAPVPVNINVAPIGPIDRAPDPVNPAVDPGITTPGGGNVTVEVTTSSTVVTPPSTTSNVFVPQTAYLTVTEDGTIALRQITTLNFLGNGVSVSGGNGTANITITAGGGSSGTYGNSNVAAFLAAYGSNSIVTTGNISAGNAAISQLVASTNIFAKTGSFSGDNNTGDNSLYVGAPTFTSLGTDVMAQFTGNVATYGQINFQNYSNSATASGDYIATADNGNDSTHYIDMGITSSAWNGTQENSLGNALFAGDGYLYVQDGNLALAVKDGVDQHVIKLDLDGTITTPGLQISGATIAVNQDSAETLITISPNIEGQAYLQIPNDATANVANVRLHNDAGNIEFGTGSGSHNWYFGSTGSLTFPNGANIRTVDELTIINSTATANGIIGINARESTFGESVAQIYLDGTDRVARVSTYNPNTEIGYDWTFDAGGSLTIPTAPGNIYMGTNTNGPVILPTSLGIEFNANRADTTQDYIEVSQDGVNIFSVNTINIENNTTGFNNSDININSGDDIFLRGRDKADDTEAEGGDINIWAGDGASSTALGNDTGGGGDIQIQGGLGGSGTGTGVGASAGGFVTIAGGDGGTSVDSSAGSGGSVSIFAGSGQSGADPSLGGIGGSVSITAGSTARVNENGGSIELTTGGSTGLGTGAAGYVAINIASSNVGPGGNWYFTGTGTALEVPANSSIYGPNFGNITVGCAGNTIITSSDYGANVKNWTFGYTGILSLPGITTATGAEAMTVAGTRTLVGGADNPNGAYAVTFSGSDPVVVYSCDILTQSAKFTFAIQTSNATFGWEQFDVAVIKLFAGGVGVTVSNRMNNNPDNGNTQVTANIGEGNEIVISLAQPGTGTAYVNYTATEFKLPID